MKGRQPPADDRASAIARPDQGLASAVASALTLGVSLATVASGVARADPPADGADPLAHNRPWQALVEMGETPANPQMAAQVATFLGRERAACAAAPSRVPRLPPDAEYRDALDVIDGLARDARVVMLNESHDRRAHRVFLGRLIERLDALGFDALAAETFAPAAPATLADGVPDAATGFYTADPAFADALRRAHALGWQFVPYESQVGMARETRETAQAEALAAWIEAHPGRRLLVYAGGSHISRDPAEGWMAARFVARTGIVPLTIAQGATACPDSAGDWPIDAPSPVVAMRGDAPVRPGPVDLVVLHPPSAVAAAEAARGARVAVCVAARDEATLLRAFGDGEDDQAIARDQAEVPAAATRVELRLPPGRYRIAREDARALETLGRVTVDEASSGGCLRVDPL